MSVVRWLVAALIAVTAITGVAHADVFDDNPATASKVAGEIYVFVRANNGEIYVKKRTGTSWGSWDSLGGNMTSGPAAVAFGGTIQVFARGPDGAVWQSWQQDDGHWAPWISLGGYATSAPAVTVRRGNTFLDLVVRGGDNQLYQRSYVPGNGWSAFAPIGGNLTTAASANSQSPGLLNIWSRGTDGSLVQKSWDGTQWIDWTSLGGGIVGAPTSVSRTENVIDVYVRGGGDTIYQRTWVAPGGWSDFALLDRTTLSSALAAGADSANHEYLFARNGSDRLLYKEWTAGIGWAGWADLGQIALPAPAPPAPSGPPAAAPLPDGSANIQTGVACTPAAGRLRVSVAIGKPKGKVKPRVSKIVFFTKGKGRKIRVDRKAPFVVRIPINRPAGSTGRVYARVYYKRTAHGKTYRKVVSRRFKVCR